MLDVEQPDPDRAGEQRRQAEDEQVVAPADQPARAAATMTASATSVREHAAAHPRARSLRDDARADDHRDDRAEPEHHQRVAHAAGSPACLRQASASYSATVRVWRSPVPRRSRSPAGRVVDGMVVAPAGNGAYSSSPIERPTHAFARRDAKNEPCEQSWKTMNERTRKTAAGIAEQQRERSGHAEQQVDGGRQRQVGDDRGGQAGERAPRVRRARTAPAARARIAPAPATPDRPAVRPPMVPHSRATAELHCGSASQRGSWNPLSWSRSGRSDRAVPIAAASIAGGPVADRQQEGTGDGACPRSAEP